MQRVTRQYTRGGALRLEPLDGSHNPWADVCPGGVSGAGVGSLIRAHGIIVPACIAKMQPPVAVVKAVQARMRMCKRPQRPVCMRAYAQLDATEGALMHALAWHAEVGAGLT